MRSETWLTFSPGKLLYVDLCFGYPKLIQGLDYAIGPGLWPTEVNIRFVQLWKQLQHSKSIAYSLDIALKREHPTLAARAGFNVKAVTALYCNRF
jgi:hypothetical protein